MHTLKVGEAGCVIDSSLTDFKGPVSCDHKQVGGLDLVMVEGSEEAGGIASYPRTLVLLRNEGLVVDPNVMVHRFVRD